MLVLVRDGSTFYLREAVDSAFRFLKCLNEGFPCQHGFVVVLAAVVGIQIPILALGFAEVLEWCLDQGTKYPFLESGK